MTLICPTSPDVGQCAEAVCDQHLSDQLQGVSGTLAYALAGHGITGRMYGNIKDADKDVGDWASEDWENFLWLSFYGLALAEESDIRFGTLEPSVSGIICGGQTGLMVSGCTAVNPMPPQYWTSAKAAPTHRPRMDVFDAHRHQMLKGYAQMAEEGSPPTWTGVNPPLWVLKHAR